MSKIEHFKSLYSMAKKEVEGASPIKCVKCAFEVRDWQIKYSLMEQEYYQFRFYEKDKETCHSYIRDWEIINVISKKFNSDESDRILTDKFEFNNMFKEYVGRDYILFDRDNISEFEEFTKRHSVFMVKPIDLNGGKGIKKYNIEGRSVKEVFDEISSETGAIIIEEVVIQHDDLASLNADTVNTLRVISMRREDGTVTVPFCNIRIGRAGKCVDNFCSGGMTAAVDVKTGKVISKAFDKFCKNFEVHPDSGVNIIGFQVPNWNEILKTVKKSAEILPGARYIGWDISVKKDGTICIIEANCRPEARIHQIALQRGLRSEYESYLGKF